VIKDDPSYCAAYIALSEQLRGRSLDEATEILLQGFRATRNPVFLIKLEDLCVETERPQAMIRIYSRLQQEFPSDYDVNLFMGKFFLRLEMIDEGLEQLLKAETLDPERESVNILLAEAFRRRGGMNRRACTTSGPSATSGGTSSPSGAPPAVPPPSSGPPGAPPAGHGTGTPSTTATGSTPSPPPCAEPPPFPAQPHPHRSGRASRRRNGSVNSRRSGPPAGRVSRSFILRRRPVARLRRRDVPPVRGILRFRTRAAPVSLRPLRRRPSPFDAARSLFAYAGDVRAAIVATKYAGRPYPADAVALRLQETLMGRWRDLIPDGVPPTVVPVPAHPGNISGGDSTSPR